MLKKLFKYELKSTSKLMLVIYAVMITVTLIGALVISYQPLSESVANISALLSSSVLICYALTAFALFVITYVFMCIHFYQTMYSDRGYLTHTLPVKPTSVLNTKLLVSLFWMLCSALLLCFSFVILAGAASKGNYLSGDEWHIFIQNFRKTTGYSIWGFVGYAVILVIVSCLLYLLLVFASASIGQMFSHKITASVAAGIGFYIAEQIISLILLVVSGYISAVQIAEASGSDPSLGVFFPLLSMILIGNIVLCAVYYLICHRVVNRHLNLD